MNPEVDKNDFHFSLGMRKILSYYLGYSILFLIIHLSAISMVSFFHFLLDHNMSIIEDWLYRNAWEMIFISKLTSAILIIKALKLNNYFVSSFFSIVKNDIWRPTKEASIFIIFIMVLFHSLIMQFGGEIIENAKTTDFTYVSYFGSIFFYLIDFLVINFLVRNIKIKGRKKFLILISSLLLIFMFFTKATLPYISKYYIFILLHFLTLLIFLFVEKKNLINPLLYSLFLIGPLSSFYGLDLVWDNAHSVYSYRDSLPIIGIIGIWSIGLLYYFKKKSKNIKP